VPLLERSHGYMQLGILWWTERDNALMCEDKKYSFVRYARSRTPWYRRQTEPFLGWDFCVACFVCPPGMCPKLHEVRFPASEGM